MGTTIFVILCIASEAFMLDCLFHFGQELRQESRRESAVDLWIASPKPNVVRLQFIGHTRIVVRSEGAWGYFISSADSESLETRTEGASKKRYDAAA